MPEAGQNVGQLIQILVNGEQQSIPEKSSLTDLLAILKIEGRLAIDVNGEIIPRSTHADHFLAADDKVEIVYAIGGGC